MIDAKGSTSYSRMLSPRRPAVTRVTSMPCALEGREDPVAQGEVGDFAADLVDLHGGRGEVGRMAVEHGFRTESTEYTAQSQHAVGGAAQGRVPGGGVEIARGGGGVIAVGGGERTVHCGHRGPGPGGVVRRVAQCV